MTMDRNNRHLWYGYTDMGPIQIPPFPFYIRLTDRDDGTLWYLEYSPTPAQADGYGFISINTVMSIPPGFIGNVLTYAPYEEPYVGNWQHDKWSRLIVRGGYLGVEEGVPARGITNEAQTRLFALQRNTGFNIVMGEIILSITIPGEYAWVPSILTQTANPV